MRSLSVVLLFVTLSAFAGGRGRVVEPAPSPSPSPLVTASPTPGGKDLVRLGKLGPSVNQAFVEKTVALINDAYRSGCLEQLVKAHKFLSLHNIDGPQVRNTTEAWERFTRNAPYTLDLNWYYKRFTNTIGYTYNYASDTGGAPGVSETRIWTNTKYITTPHELAKHYVHETSHQARAGAFVHYTVHSGSFPYDTGYMVGDCF